MTILKKWETKDYYFDQVEEEQANFVPATGEHAGHEIHHRETYENCGALDVTQYCVTCGTYVYRSAMNGCWQYEHKREEEGKALVIE